MGTPLRDETTNYKESVGFEAQITEGSQVCLDQRKHYDRIRRRHEWDNCGTYQNLH